VTSIDYVARWRHIVAARREQHDAAYAAQGRTIGDYWARRAEGFRRFVRESADAHDPLLELVRRELRPDDLILDVGAGTGRHALPLARQVRTVFAVDPSPAMLHFLREDAEAEGLRNVEVIEGSWPEVADRVPSADIAISAHVLYPIEDVVGFLQALDAQARRLCALQLMVWQPWFDQVGLWEGMHGQPRLPQPTYIDALNLLHQLGCYASVEIGWIETQRQFDSLDEAVERFAETVAVGEAPELRRRLRDALAERLEAAPGGRLTLPSRRYPIATVWWEAGALRTS